MIYSSRAADGRIEIEVSRENLEEMRRVRDECGYPCVPTPDVLFDRLEDRRLIGIDLKIAVWMLRLALENGGRGETTVAHLSGWLGRTTRTIRRSLERLEDVGFLIRTDKANPVIDIRAGRLSS